MNFATIKHINKSKTKKSIGWIALFLLACASGYFLLHRDKEKVLQINQITSEDVAANNEVVSNNSFKLSIPSLKISSPILLEVDPADKEKYNQALKRGVAHMVGTSLPGKNTGNIFIYGHSSATEPSEFSKVFANLNDLTERDSILLNYEGKSYTYSVSIKRIVEKDDFSVLETTDNEVLTLMTCWPVGTKDKRLIVTANRI